MPVEKAIESVRLSESFVQLLAFTYRQFFIILLRYCTMVKLKDANASRFCWARSTCGYLHCKKKDSAYKGRPYIKGWHIAKWLSWTNLIIEYLRHFKIIFR